jgi:hypothetical protein
LKQQLEVNIAMGIARNEILRLCQKFNFRCQLYTSLPWDPLAGEIPKAQADEGLGYLTTPNFENYYF